MQNTWTVTLVIPPAYEVCNAVGYIVFVFSLSLSLSLSVLTIFVSAYNFKTAWHIFMKLHTNVKHYDMTRRTHKP